MIIGGSTSESLIKQFALKKMKKIFIKNRKNQNICVETISNSNPKSIAFVMHGLGSFKEKKHIRVIAQVLKENNYLVVLFDATNSFGESDGNYENATLTNYYQDLEDVIAWAKKQKWYKAPFILSGHSFGGFCATYYAENHPKEVLAIAPIAPMISGKLSAKAHKQYDPENFRKWRETGWLIRESDSMPGVIKRLPWSHFIDRQKYDLLPEAKKLTMPVLIISGENDTSIPIKHSRILFDALPGPKEFHIIKNAPHSFKTSTHLKQLERLFKNWISKLNTHQKVYDIIAQIPKGKVTTYGQIAKMAGIKSSRQVGSILHKNQNPQKYPCHRVVNYKGQTASNYAFGGKNAQNAKLKAEGVIINKGAVDLDKYSWKISK